MTKLVQNVMIKPTHLTIDSQKFYSNGQPREYPGSTIVSHLPQEGENSELFSTLLDVYRNLIGLDPKIKNKFSLLPTSSYHMTVVSCSDVTRIPSNLVSDNSNDQKTLTKIKECLKTELNLSPAIFPIHVRAKEIIIADGCGITLIVEPLRETIENLHQIRKAVGDLLGVEIDPNHRFHVTLAYFVDEFTDDEFMSLKQNLDDLNRKFFKGQEVEFGQIEFCFFKDMFQFQIQNVFN